MKSIVVLILLLVGLILVSGCTQEKRDIKNQQELGVDKADAVEEPKNSEKENLNQVEENYSKSEDLDTEKSQEAHTQKGNFLDGQYYEQDNRESLEIPSQSEREKLPECSDVLYTVPFVDPDKIREIAPLGSLNPPEHTIPTNHVYSHLDIPRESTQTVSLYLPADAWITHISTGTGMTQDPEDSTVYFAVCKDVVGYFNHIKKLSPEVQKIVNSYQCPQGGSNCFVQVLEPLKKGSYLGEVGRLQGNFDFGTIDLRTQHNFINKERYAKRTLHIQCPFDYYSEDLKEKYYNLLQSKKNCGKINFDIPGTLQGNWFYGDSREYFGGDWVKHAFFGYDNVNPEKSVISIGGVVVPESSGLRWKFSASTTGQNNRKFSNVVPGKVYCYDIDDQDQFNKGPSGRILVELENEKQIKLEHQNGDCSGSLSFSEGAKVYDR